MPSSLSSAHCLSSNIICQICDVLGHSAEQCPELSVSLSSRYGPFIRETDISSPSCSLVVSAIDRPSLFTATVVSTISTVAASQSTPLFPSDASPSVDTSDDWPTGSETWHSSPPLPPRQSSRILSPHHFHSQHERDYFVAKSISSSSDSTLVSTPSINTLQCTEVDSFWPEGLTSWLSEPLPPRSPPVLSDDAVPTSPKILYSSPPAQGTNISFPSAACMVSSLASHTQIGLSDGVSSTPLRRRHIKHPISSTRNTCPASPTSFFPRHRPSRQFSFSAIILALLQILLFTLTSVRSSFHLNGSAPARDLHPVQQFWHVMVP